MSVYNYALGVCLVITFALTIKSRSGSSRSRANFPEEVKKHQCNFLVAYYISMLADWLQGPYVYALYSSYGFSKDDIAVLFVGGFGASMIFGTFAGSLADRFGRKRACQLYCVLYILSCATKHGKDYWVLMIGRITGGIATSLLFSAFESWMVCESNSRGFDSSVLDDTFSLMYFGNSVAAIVAGLVAQGAADAVALTPLSPGGIWHYGGYCTPFDISAGCLFVALFLITKGWTENYGDSTASSAGGGGDGAASANR